MCGVSTTTLTYTRRLVRGNHVYLYHVTSYRDKETGRAKQKSEYVGKEFVKGNVTTGQKPLNRITARQVLDSAPYIMYRFAEDFGLQDSIMTTLEGLTNMREAGRRIDIRSIVRDGVLTSLIGFFTLIAYLTHFELEGDFPCRDGCNSFLNSLFFC